MQFHVDPAKCNQLNLRQAPSPGEIIASLPAGTDVDKLGEHATQPHWWQVTAHLNGQGIGGFVNSNFLKEGAGFTLDPTISTALPACNLTPNSHRRKDDFGRANPLDEPNMPRRGAGTAAQKRDALVEISKYLDTGNSAHLRYVAGGGKTYCNIYAYDFAMRAGTFVPRVFWTPAAIDKIENGATLEVLYGNTVRELTANVLHDWFIDYGGGFGWGRVFSATELQDGANAGKVAIIVAKRVNLARSGHILAVLPEHDGISAARDGQEVTRPVQSQAGAENFRARVTPTRWWMDSRFQSFGFWLHD